MFALSEAHLLQHLSGQPQASAAALASGASASHQQAAKQAARRAQAQHHIRGIEQADEAALRKQLRIRGANRRNAERRNGYLEQSEQLAAEIIARLHPDAAAKAKAASGGAGGKDDMHDDFDDMDDDDLFDDLGDL